MSIRGKANAMMITQSLTRTRGSNINGSLA